MKKIIFITGNKHKLEIANSVFSIYDIDVENRDIEPNEIQETDIEKIASFSALEAAKTLEVPVIKTDVGYAEPNGYCKTFRMDTPLTIRISALGTGSVMDKLMNIEGQKANYGSLTLDEKLEWWRNNDNYFHEFAKWYIERN